MEDRMDGGRERKKVGVCALVCEYNMPVWNMCDAYNQNQGGKRFLKQGDR